MIQTIISLVPYKIDEVKPGIFPNRYTLEAATEDDFSILHVDDAKHHVYLDAKRGTLVVPCLAEDLARSIVNDFVQACLAVDEDAGPGIFYVIGKKTKAQIKSDHFQLMEKYRQRQISWFKRLVEMADDDWERTRQHKTISDLQRFAARALKLERPWLINLAENLEQSQCPACKQVINPDAVICPFCRCVLRPDKHKAMQFAG